jgi:hypothetical protein
MILKAQKPKKMYVIARAMRQTLNLLFVLPFMTTSIGAEAVFLKLGYGGIWQFYDEPLPTASPTSSTSTSSPASRTGSVGVGDRFTLGFDLKVSKQHAFSGSFNTGLAYDHKSVALGGLSYKWFPLEWYNAPFIGAGVDYFGLALGSQNNVNRFGVHLTYGLNIQFPENVFLIIDFKNVFFDSISNDALQERYTHFLILTASISYRIAIGE